MPAASAESAVAERGMTRATVVLATLALLTVTPQRPVASTEPGASQTGVDIFHRLELANAARAARLRSYLSTRRYSVWEPGHAANAAVVVSMEFVAPSTKTFTTVSETGVGWIHRRVFRGLIEAEREMRLIHMRRKDSGSKSLLDKLQSQLHGSRSH